jgi:hypothetical protein
VPTPRVNAMFMAIWTLHKVGTSVKLCSSSPGGRWSLRGCVLVRLRWQCAPGPSGHHNGDTAFTRRSAYNIGGPHYAGSLNFRMQSWVVAPPAQPSGAWRHMVRTRTADGSVIGQYANLVFD